MYYQSSLLGNIDFSVGTAAVQYITIFFSSILGLSFFGTSLVFSIFGFIGLLAFDGSLRAATIGKSKNIQYIATLIIFLPSVSFWSSSLGKDSLSFMSTGLALWAALNLRRRVWLMGISIIIMLIVRPHMAGMMVLALVGAQTIQRRVPLTQRMLLGTLGIAASILIVPFALNYAGIKGDINTQDIASYIAQRQQTNLEGGSSIDIASMSIPMQLFTYLFRPLPFEATSIFSFATSIDNMVLLCLVISGAWIMLKTRRRDLMGNRTFLWMYSLLAWTILAMTTANMGIAARQKWMFTPMLIFLLISLLGKSNMNLQKKIIQHEKFSI